MENVALLIHTLHKKQKYDLSNVYLSSNADAGELLSPMDMVS